MSIVPDQPLSLADIQRPYIRSGHAPLNATDGVTPTMPPAAHTINADQFNRPLITAGHMAEPPGSRPDNAQVSSVRTGAARELYSTAANAAAATAVSAIRDHIEQTRLTATPMSDSRTAMPVGMHDAAVPRPTSMPPARVAPGETDRGVR